MSSERIKGLLDMEISELTASIQKMEQDAGWNLAVNIYNRDWKKNVSAAKKRLRELVAQRKEYNV